MWFGVLSLPVIGSMFFNSPTYVSNGLFSGYLITMTGSLGDLYLFYKVKNYDRNWFIYPSSSKEMRGFTIKQPGIDQAPPLSQSLP
jgi:hypothetical protein